MSKKWYPYADLVLKNAKIYTVDLKIPEIQAGNYDFTTIDNGYVAVKDGKIIGVGSGLDESFIGEMTEVVDAEGKTLIPGLVDSHMHAMWAGMDLLNVNLKDCKTLDEMLGLIKERVDQVPEGTWIKGAAWNELNWTDGKKPDRYTLDDVSGNCPVFAKRLCCHVIVANSMALKLAGITKDTPDPDGGIIGRDENGEPNGWLFENSAMDLIEKVFPPLTEAQLIDAIEGIGKYINSVGITTVIDANMTFDCMRSYKEAYKAGRLTYRDNMMFYLDKALGDIPYHLNRIKEMTAVTGFGDDMLKYNGIKVTLDGIPASGTAYMRKNYAHMPETRGYTTITPEEMKEVCRYASRYNWQVGVHTIGDAAIDVALDAFEAGAEKKDNLKNRNYLIHAVFPREDMIPRLQKMNVPVTLQPTITGTMGEESILEEEYNEINQPCGFYFDNHIICGGSSDFPVVDCNPFIGMSKAITRICLDGKVHGPQYRINAKQALIMWTMNSAYFSFDEEKLGSIEVGKLADLVIIDTPLLEATPDEIMNTKVLKTYLGGKLVYEKQD